MKNNCINCGMTWEGDGFCPSCFPEWKATCELRKVRSTEHAYELGEFGQPLWHRPCSREVEIIQQKWIKGGEWEWRDIPFATDL